MITRWLTRSMAVLLVLAAGAGAMAEDVGELDPLLKLLVERGVITIEEARAVQAEYDRSPVAEAEIEAAHDPDAIQPEPTAAVAQEVSLASAGTEYAGVKDLKIGTLAYLSYQNGSTGGGEGYNQFRVKRAYLDVRKKLTANFGARLTPDVVQESDGDLEVRFKYLYGQFNWQRFGFVHKPYVEFGVAHMPWLDFEEHINRFRMQDTMFMERNGLFNSADIGVLFGGNLGPELDQEYRERVNDHYAGRWGSFGIGVYNGGGYHAVENNENKVVEGRLTVRPIPDSVPGLQFSVFGVNGDGNASDRSPAGAPGWDVLAGMASYESPRLVLTVQYEQGSGNQQGSLMGPDGRELDHDGYSFFGELRLDRDQEWSVIGRYDRFDVDRQSGTEEVSERWIAGLAWRFFKGNYWLLDYDRLENSDPGRETEDRIQLTLQIKY